MGVFLDHAVNRLWRLARAKLHADLHLIGFTRVHVVLLTAECHKELRAIEFAVLQRMAGLLLFGGVHAHRQVDFHDLQCQPARCHQGDQRHAHGVLLVERDGHHFGFHGGLQIINVIVEKLVEQFYVLLRHQVLRGGCGLLQAAGNAAQVAGRHWRLAPVGQRQRVFLAIEKRHVSHSLVWGE